MNKWQAGLVCLLVTIWIWDPSNDFNPKTHFESSQKNISKEIKLRREALVDIVTQIEQNEPFESALNGYSFPINLLRRSKPIAWNSNSIFPKPELSDKSPDIFLDRDTTFIILKLDFEWDDFDAQALAYLKLRSRYDVQNQYLQDVPNSNLFGENVLEFGEGEDLLINEPIDLKIRILNQNKPTSFTFQDLLFLLVIFNIFWISLTIKSRILFHILFSFAIGGGRLIQLIFFDDLQLFNGILFDPLIYSAGKMNPSIGDLILNFMLSFWIIMAIMSVIQSNVLAGRKYLKSQVWSFVILNMTLVLGFAAVKFVFEVGWSIQHDSQMVYDITNSLEMGGLKIVGYVVLLMSFGGYFLINYFWIRIRSLLNVDWRREVTSLLIISLGFFLLPTRFNLYLGLVHLCLLLFFFISRSYSETRTKGLQGYDFIAILLALSTVWSIAIYKYEESNQNLTKNRFAANLIVGNDLIGEYHLADAIEKIKDDPTIRTRLLKSTLVDKNITARINRHVPVYLSNYELRIFIYDSLGESFGTIEGIEGLEYWTENFKYTQFKTSHEDIYCVNELATGNHKYIAFIELNQGKTLILDLTLKRHLSRSVFPSLLAEGGGTAFSGNQFEYGFYNADGLLLFSRGEFPFSGLDPTLVRQVVTKSNFERDGYHFFGRTVKGGNTLLVVSEEYSLRNIFSNLSFMFIATLFVLSLMLPIFLKGLRLNQAMLKTKLQWYLGFVFAIPVIVVSVGILNVLNDSYRKEIDKSNEKRSRNIAERLSGLTQSFKLNEINKDQLAEELVDASELTEKDIILFDEQGHLMGSNRQQVFDLNLMSDLINPKALEVIQSRKVESMIMDEAIGSLEFKTVYSGIYSSSKNELIGILAVPFFDFKNHLNRQQIEVFNSLTNLFMVIFILTLMIGNYGVARLLDPIQQLSDRLKRVNYLTGKYETLTYNSKDEIGLLVNEYNRMTKKLDESKEDLARMQKESAWKEIARQVAHEIKNPLTPMKLKIQQMQRSGGLESVEYKSLDSLLTQVDTLSSIADSFSAFAKLPAPQIVVLDFSELVETAVSIHKLDEHEVKLKLETKILIEGDPKILSQIINNIMLNALQSIVDIDKRIQVVLNQKGQKATLAITDNGSGIPNDIKDNIFVPYFSTKDEGSGIGLALAKKGIEQLGGNIWFESEEGEGTTFFIDLPVA